METWLIIGMAARLFKPMLPGLKKRAKDTKTDLDDAAVDLLEFAIEVATGDEIKEMIK